MRIFISSLIFVSKGMIVVYIFLGISPENLVIGSNPKHLGGGYVRLSRGIHSACQMGWTPAELSERPQNKALWGRTEPALFLPCLVIVFKHHEYSSHAVLFSYCNDSCCSL